MKDRGIICELGVKDVKTSLEFYTLLGCKQVELVPSADSPSWAELEFHGSRIMLQESRELVDEIPGLAVVPARPSHVIVFRVGSIADAESLNSSLASEVGRVTDIKYTDYGTAEFAVNDPDGYVVLIAGSS